MCAQHLLMLLRECPLYAIHLGGLCMYAYISLRMYTPKFRLGAAGEFQEHAQYKHSVNSEVQLVKPVVHSELATEH
jgi:hypothetical protein